VEPEESDASFGAWIIAFIIAAAALMIIASRC
jgi:hypothetical protein